MELILEINLLIAEFQQLKCIHLKFGGFMFSYKSIIIITVTDITFEQLTLKALECHDQGKYLYVNTYLLIKLIPFIFRSIYMFHNV